MKLIIKLEQKEKIVKGIKSVDFKIRASGHGCVNWNGSTALKGEDGKEIKNHTLPKLRGFSNKTGEVKEGSNYEYKIGANDISLEKTPMYVSQNSLRHHIFKKEMPFHLGKLDDSHAEKFLKSPVGLLRGYAITSNIPIMKKSPLLLEDLLEILHNGNFEILSTTSGKEGSETGGFYSKTTVGDTEYIGYGSINVEELQFISCDGLFGRSAVGVKATEESCIKLAKDITEMLDYIKEDENLSPNANFESCYVRKGSFLDVGEAGILLNGDACYILVNYLIDNIRNLYIHQAKSWLRVDQVLVDYNDSKKPFRIKGSESDINEEKKSDFSVYYAKANEEQIKTTNIEKKKYGLTAKKKVAKKTSKSKKDK